MKYVNLNPLIVSKLKGKIPSTTEIQFATRLGLNLSDQVAMRYDVVRSKNQHRFQSQILLTPQVDLNKLKFWLGIEYLKIKGKYTNCIDWEVLQAEIALCSDGSCRIEDHGNGEFHIIFDHPTPKCVICTMQKLHAWPEVHTEGEIYSIKIAMQVVSQSVESELCHWQVVDLLWRHFLPPSEVWNVQEGLPYSLNSDGDDGSGDIYSPQGGAIARGELWMNRHIDDIWRSYGIRYPKSSRFLEYLEPSSYVQAQADGAIFFGGPEEEIYFFVSNHAFPSCGRGDERASGRGTETYLPSIVVSIRGDELRHNNLTNCYAIGDGLRQIGRKYLKFWLPVLNVTGGCLITSAELERFRNGGCFAARQAALAKREKDAYLNPRALGRRKRTGWKRTANEDFEGLTPFAELNERVAAAVRNAAKTWAYLR
ncbi:hypothetical protein SAMN05421759_1161 [Roseivivax lentus]|uniref:Uncharacterized protein n=1 Tax=Roseivivax lentus TaxID=633194 RepID=A0A1N7PI60_9RHOB|nr:hypothetical protein [Roseivivax lentus]SIT10200.1 hypothetical protein SAMN05421759_1161 [Roseivivax lentus]